MARKSRYLAPGTIEYKGYTIGLNDEGKIVCGALGIVGDTLDDVKKAIRATEEKIAKLPMVNAWFRPRFGKLTLGKTNGRGAGFSNKYVWVSWKDERGKNHREQIYSTNVYPDTQENRELIERIVYLEKARSGIMEEIEGLSSKLEMINLVNE